MYRKILAPLDGSDFSRCSLQHVKAIAAGCQVPEVVLLRVVEPIVAADLSSYAMTGIDTGVLMREMEAAAVKYVTKMAEELRTAGLSAQGVVTLGQAADRILSYTAENGVDLIIMSTHGRSGISRWFMGSVADKVVRHASVPVLIVPPPGCRTGVWR